MANEKIGVFKEPCGMFDQDSGWIGFVRRRIDSGVKTRVGREKHGEWFVKKGK
jgi:hypothetical protein